jgi:hypothetical protein
MKTSLKDLFFRAVYGEGRAGVIRRFVENGIAREIRRKVIDKKTAQNFGKTTDTES